MRCKLPRSGARWRRSGAGPRRHRSWALAGSRSQSPPEPGDDGEGPEPGAPMTHAKHIVFATIGSLGDIYPFIALALGMASRGHLCTIATSELFRETVEAQGLRFAPIAPDLSQEPDFIANAWDPKRHGKLFGEIIRPAMRQSYFDLMAITPQADLLVTRGLVYAAPIVVEMTGVPWVTTKLVVGECLSAFDLPHKASLAPLFRMAGDGGLLKRLVVRLFKTHFQRAYLGPIRDLRQELGLPRSTHWRYWGNIAPRRDMVLFSSVLGAPQPDWRPYAAQAGFIFRDDVQPAPPLAPELEAFLARGPAPMVFTLGSQQFGPTNRTFLKVSLDAAQRLGQRAVLLTGSAANRSVLPEVLPEGIMAVEQAWHGTLFPQASVVVNHAGAGTTGVALRSGRPQLAVPFAFDQPDNARRLVARGVALAIDGPKYAVEPVTTALHRLLSAPAFAARAQEAAAIVAGEQGLTRACDMMEDVLMAEAPARKAG